MVDITRTIDKEIKFKIRNKETGDPIDITTATDIRACIQTLILNLASGITITSAILGEFEVALTPAQTTGLTIGIDSVEGQVEFGTTEDPIEFAAAVEIKDKPC